jgi:hypothetical protein
MMRRLRWLAGFLGTGMVVAALAQSLPPIYEQTPVALAPTTTLAEFPKGSFLENVAVDGQGRLFVNSYLDGKIYRIEAGGAPNLWASIDGTIAGIALNPDGSAVVSGWIGGKEPAVFAVDAQGRSRVLVRLPGGKFPNGVVRLAAGRFLVADSYRGAIWLVDSVKATASVWLEHESLTRANPQDGTPAANGMKLLGSTLYVSNTARQQLVRVPVADGAAGTPEVWLRRIGLDDFAFDDKGVLYGTTHVYNSLVRITPDGQVSVIAGLAQGMAGSTAVAAAPAAGGGWHLFVTTNGGLSLPPPGGVQAARVLRVEIGARP